MNDSLESARHLIRSGLFRQALATLQHAPHAVLARPDVEVTLADVLQRVGQGEGACALAGRYASRTQTPPSLRAEAHLVLGTEYRARGEMAKAVHHLRKAITLAEGTENQETKCWAELRLMLALQDSRQTKVSDAFLAQARSDVARLGDPRATAALHLFVAEIETKRGVLNGALQHIRIASDLLGAVENRWLDGTCAINTSCLCYLVSDFDSALQHARRALDCAETSGHQGNRTAAFGNLGHLYLTAQQLPKADRCLSHALRLSRGGETHAGALDGLAQVKLARRDLVGCERILASIARFGVRERQVSRFYEFWTSITRLRLLLKQQAIAEALSVAAGIASDVTSLDDQLLSETLKTLKAEALLMDGAVNAATDVVCEIARAGGRKPLETLPRVERIVARVCAANADAAAAAEWFERSARMLASSADECSRAEALEDYAALLAPLIGTPDDDATTTTLEPFDTLRPGAARVTVHPDATRIGPDLPPISAASTLYRATTLFDFADRPLSVAHEVLDLLQRCRAVSHAAIFARGGSNAELVAFWGDFSRLDHLLAGQAPAVERILIGRWRDRELEVVAEVRPDLESRVVVVAARRLVAASQELEAARRERREHAALWPLAEPIDGRHGVFASRAMADLVATARKIASSDATVLVTGETGSGKDVIARIIHDASPRAARPFLPFNCAAVPRDMLDSQLFGHRRGAFTGAINSFPGVIRSAAGGTLLLDEIGELTADLQPKLLRFLESQEIQPVGETRPVTVDVRVIAATNAEVEDLVASGRFREDLYYRLNVIRLRVPPLRERREEIPLLVQHFLKRFTEESRKPNVRLAEETMEYLALYRWPGNVRELLNQMRRLAALAEPGAVLMPEHLAPEILGTRRTAATSARGLAPCEILVRLDQPLSAAVEHLERAMLPWAMRAAHGRMDDAAKMLGLSRKGLYLKRQRLGLDPAPDA